MTTPNRKLSWDEFKQECWAWQDHVNAKFSLTDLKSPYPGGMEFTFAPETSFSVEGRGRSAEAVITPPGRGVKGGDCYRPSVKLELYQGKELMFDHRADNFEDAAQVARDWIMGGQE